jgi:hypothetical protein
MTNNADTGTVLYIVLVYYDRKQLHIVTYILMIQTTSFKYKTILLAIKNKLLNCNKFVNFKHGNMK